MLYITLFFVSLALIFMIKPSWSFKRQILIFVGGVVLTIASFWGYDIYLSSESIAKGEEERGYFFEGFLFIVMLIGMASKYIFDELDKEEFKFNIRKFIKPMFVSPMVFMGVISQLNEVAMSGFIVYAFAFQNGFFWQSVLEKKA